MEPHRPAEYSAALGSGTEGWSWSGGWLSPTSQATPGETMTVSESLFCIYRTEDITL